MSAERRVFTVLLGLALPVYFLFLGANTIWEANEAFYVETPRQMVLSGDYVTPTFNAQPRLNKPVLSYWIVAGLYQALGISVAVERIGIALGALGLVGATFLIGRALGSAPTGVLAALVLATAPRVVMHARRIFIDVYIALFMALALAAFVLAERHPEHRRRYLLLMYVAIGLGVLTKGPIAIVLPAAAVLAWLVIERRLGDIRRLMALPGAIVVLAIVAPWYIALHQTHGWDPIWTFVAGENVERYLQPMAPGRGIAYYVPVLLGELFPWSPLVLLPLFTAWRRTPGDSASPAAIRRLLWCWIVVIVGAFSLSRTKLDLYIFPVMPAVAALVADLLVRTGFGSTSRGVRIGLSAISVAVVLVGGAVWYLFRGGHFALPHAAGVGQALIIVGVLALFWMRRSGAAAVMSLATGLVGFNYLLAGWILPESERWKPVPAFVQKFNEGHAPNAKIGAYAELLPSLVFYLDRPIEIVGSPDQFIAFFRDSPEAWITVRESDWGRLRDLVPSICVAVRHPALEARAGDLIRGSPPPDVLFVTNRCPPR